MLGVSNLNKDILNKLNENHHRIVGHPINVIKVLIEKASSLQPMYDDINPLVSTHDNFDALRVPKDHPSRRESDTYYLNDDWVIRTHTTAHLSDLARENDQYLVCGVVARKDTIDATHYPVFTQMDAYCETENPDQDLKAELTRIITALYPGREYRFSEDYFPFTINSIEAEVKFGDKWVEILGGGTVHPEIMAAIGKPNKQAYAFGLGLDRLAMIQFAISDIRLLWSKDKRFTDQFLLNFVQLKPFEPFSNHPPCIKDVAFWIHQELEVEDGEWLGSNALYELIREVAGDLVESVELIDSFQHPKKGLSNCFRITYRSFERSLTNKEVNELQEEVRRLITQRFNITLR
jgi:phenylalanyl-tRNA synthetase alpha chain